MSKQQRATAIPTITVVSPAIALSEIVALAVQPYDSLEATITSALQTLSLLLYSRTLFLARFDLNAQEEHVLTAVQVLDQYGCPVTPGKIGPLLQTYCNIVRETCAPLVIPDVTAMPDYHNMAITSQLNIGSYVGVPLIYSNRRIYGTLCGLDPTPLTFDCTQVQTLQIVAQLLVMHIEREEMLAALRQKAQA